jgi:hypothetical protein
MDIEFRCKDLTKEGHCRNCHFDITECRDCCWFCEPDGRRNCPSVCYSVEKIRGSFIRSSLTPKRETVRPIYSRGENIDLE